jgi:hypothetical protein
MKRDIWQYMEGSSVALPFLGASITHILVTVNIIYIKPPLMQMRYLDNVTAPPISYITISAVVAMFLWFLAVADNPQSVTIDNDIKNKVKHLIQSEPKSHLQKLSKSPPPIQIAAAAPTAEQPTEPLSIKIQNVTAGNPTSNNMSTISIAFDIRNHNQNTILLEGLNYNLYYGDHRIVAGSIGSQLISDIFQSQSEYPIIGKGFLVLKDKQTFEEGSEDDKESFSDILKGNAHYMVNGTVYYKQISNIQAYGGTQQFEATFP